MQRNENYKKLPNFKISVQGHFDANWEGWFDGMSITCQTDGNTLLIGYLPDQPALFGLIAKLQEMGITLISINRINYEGGTYV